MAARRRSTGALAKLTGGRGVARGTKLTFPAYRPTLTSPPPGTYDPAIDAQVGQAQRGLGDMLSDYVRDFGEPGTALGGRSGEDYTLGKQQVQRQLDDGMQDIGRSGDRGLADILRDRARGGEDYQTSIAGVQRGFAQLGAAQGQTARAAGVQRGGALAQALAKRQANEQIARKPIDTGFQRFGADSAQAETRLGEDRSRATERLQTGAGLDFGALDRGLLRGTEDAATGLARADRENTRFGLDATAQRFYQANVPLPLGQTGGGMATSVRGPVVRTTKTARRRTTAGRQR